MLDSDLLQYHLYQKHLAKRYAGQWPAVPWEQWKNPIDSGHLLQLVGTLYQTNEVYYLQPSFGYYFENFYLEPRGPVYKLTQFTDQSVMPPPLTAADIANNQAAWAKLDLAHGSDLLRLVQHKLGGGQLLGQYLARALSYWGVCLQRNQQPEPAARWFAT